MSKDNPYPIILAFLSRGQWYAPHEVSAELRRKKYRGSYDAVTARMRDLRKPRYGAYNLDIRKRIGTKHYEYRVQLQQSLYAEQEKAA